MNASFTIRLLDAVKREQLRLAARDRRLPRAWRYARERLHLKRLLKYLSRRMARELEGA